MNKAIITLIPYMIGFIFVVLCDVLFKLSSTTLGFFVFHFILLGIAKIFIMLNRNEQHKKNKMMWN